MGSKGGALERGFGRGKGGVAAGREDVLLKFGSSGRGRATGGRCEFRGLGEEAGVRMRESSELWQGNGLVEGSGIRVRTVEGSGEEFGGLGVENRRREDEGISVMEGRGNAARREFAGRDGREWIAVAG